MIKKSLDYFSDLLLMVEISSKIFATVEDQATMFSSKRQNMMTHWRSVISQKNWILNYTAATTSELAL